MLSFDSCYCIQFFLHQHFDIKHPVLSFNTSWTHVHTNTFIFIFPIESSWAVPVELRAHNCYTWHKGQVDNSYCYQWVNLFIWHNSGNNLLWPYFWCRWIFPRMFFSKQSSTLFCVTLSVDNTFQKPFALGKMGVGKCSVKGVGLPAERH